MLIEIDDSKTVSDIQDRFSLCFPFLKIEFYHKPHRWEESSLTANRVDPSTVIGEIRKKHHPGILEIKSWYKTGDVEHLFKKLFGLNAQIFRLQDGHWKQSTQSDNLTLKTLTEMALESKQA